MDKDGHLLGVEAAGQIVEGHLDDVLAHLLGVVDVVGQGLCVGDEDEHLLVVGGLLQFDAAAQRPDVMTDMEAAGGAVAGEYYLFFAHGVV